MYKTNKYNYRKKLDLLEVSEFWMILSDYLVLENIVGVYTGAHAKLWVRTSEDSLQDVFCVLGTKLRSSDCQSPYMLNRIAGLDYLIFCSLNIISIHPLFPCSSLPKVFFPNKIFKRYSSWATTNLQPEHTVAHFQSVWKQANHQTLTTIS